MEKIIRTFFLVLLITIPVEFGVAYSSSQSALSISPYAIPDRMGRATLDAYNALLVTSSSTLPLAITIETGAPAPILDVSVFCEGDSVVLPAIQITAHNVYDLTMFIATSTQITTTDTPWDCTIGLPTQATATLPNRHTLSKAFEIGTAETLLSINTPVKLIIPNEAGKKVGYSRSNNVIQEISDTCESRSNISRITDQLKENKYYCSIESGNDVIIWTRRSAKFATYSRTRDTENNQNSSSGGGGSVGTVPSSLLTFYALPPIVTTPIVTPVSSAITTTSVNSSQSVTVPVTSATTNTVVSAPKDSTKPTKLFDIGLTIDEPVIASSSDLVAQIQFTSFGSVPTLVDLDYRIENSSGIVLYNLIASTTVETEQIVRQNFTDLHLDEGNYTLILTTNYGENVRDEFKQVFEVREPKTEENKLFTTTTILVFVSSVLFAGGLYLFARYIRRKRSLDNII